MARTSSWKTSEILQLLSPLGCLVQATGQGGDCDTNNLLLTATGAAPGNHLYLVGFLTTSDVFNPDDTYIEMIELSDGQDSQGGLNTDDPPTAQLYLQVRKLLRDAGHIVVNSMNDYF